MSGYLYALGDADDVRKKVQGYLLSESLEHLARFSANLTTALQEIAQFAETGMNADVIFLGGDDILLRFHPDDFRESKLNEMMLYFEERTDVTISFGIGRSTEEAFLNLARAKSKGPGTLLFHTES